MRKFVFAILSIVAFNVSALTECKKTTDRIYIGEDGAFWMIFSEGGSAFTTNTDPDFDNLYTMVLAAHMARKPITVRYAEATVQCNAENRSDIRGIWLEND